MSNLFICEKCGCVVPESEEQFCLVCHGKLIPLGITEEEANNKYKEIMEQSKLPIPERNECIRKDYYYGKIENPQAKVAITNEEYTSIYGKTIHCPSCNSKMVWTIDDTHICRICGKKWKKED